MKDKDKKVKISITGAGLSYQGELDQKTAGEIVALCLSSIADPDSVLTSGNAITQQQNKGGSESPSEYYNRHAPNRNPDKILTLAGYIKEVRGVSSFHPNEVKTLFRDVVEVLPANFTRDFRNTIKLGWIAPDHTNKKNFYVTRTGIEVLANEFPKELKESVYKANGRKKKIVKETTG